MCRYAKCALRDTNKNILTYSDKSVPNLFIPLHPLFLSRSGREKRPQKEKPPIPKSHLQIELLLRTYGTTHVHTSYTTTTLAYCINHHLVPMVQRALPSPPPLPQFPSILITLTLKPPSFPPGFFGQLELRPCDIPSAFPHRSIGKDHTPGALLLFFRLSVRTQV